MKAQDTNSSTSPAASTSLCVAADPTLDYMKREGLPMTRETYLKYLNLNWPDGVPSPLSAEHEMDMPEVFRTASPSVGVETDLQNLKMDPALAALQYWDEKKPQG